uniref:G_PROTEIN_RECEP_F1_2 domain-containing protein n=1 Tax=Caenorhabditis tropicalis TaxID=1561998 RepID=A0A1I7UKB3_9PELO
MQKHLLEAVTAVGMALGIFGNVNVVVAICRKKVLRTKGAMFVMALALTHLVCNVSEVIGLIFQFRFRPMSRKTCFEYNILYCFAVMFQSALFLSMALDICFSIVLPIKHMIWKKRNYVTAMCIFPTIFAISTTLISFLFIPDEETPYCIFMLTTDIRIYQMVSSSLIVLNTLTLLIIILSVLCAVRKSENMRGSRHSSSSRANSLRGEKSKVFRSTFFLVLIYIISWWSVVIIFRVMVEIVHDVREVVHYMPYLIIIVMPNFCQAYYVTYFRSPRFRKAFREQLNWITFGYAFPKTFDKERSKGSKHGSATNSANGHQQHTDSDGKKIRDGSQKSIRFSVQADV